MTADDLALRIESVEDDLLSSRRSSHRCRGADVTALSSYLTWLRKVESRAREGERPKEAAWGALEVGK